jgi:gamma-glutamyl-gamma-aminobutyrate hydrolase PuuD
MSRPLIGISASLHDFGDYGGVGVQRPLFAAGALPMTLPQLPHAVPALLDALDGVVLAPGRDIEPSRYGEAPDALLAATEPLRDEFELALVRLAVERELPVLGMCRGVQMLNVALGGTLVQDLSLIDSYRDHPSDPGWAAWRDVESASLAGAEVPVHPRHEIQIAPDSILARALGSEHAEVSSFHHQAIARLGRGLRVVARADDGAPEALELPGRDVLAVQWELQEEWRVDAGSLGIFDWFVTAAAARVRPAGAA